MRDDFIILVRLIISRDRAEIACYSGDFNETYDSEREFCHHYSFQTSSEALKNIRPDDYADSSSVLIDKTHNRVFLLNDWTGSENDFEYQSIKELDRPIELVLTEKIAHLKGIYDVEYKNSTMFHERIEEVKKFIKKENDIESRKLAFFKSEKNIEKLNQTIGKLEVAKKVEELLEKKFS